MLTLRTRQNPAGESIRTATAPGEPFCNILIPMHQFAESLGEAVDVKDHYTRNHSQEVAVLAFQLACAMDLEPEFCAAVHIAGHLHDLGKIGISDRVLHKPGPLSEEEWQEMKKHPALGFEIIRRVPALTGRDGIANMVLCHHERHDGGGYPAGLRAEEIPLGARILAVADTVSAMTGNRRYRQPCAWPEVAVELERVAGWQLDPAVVRIFLQTAPQARAALAL